MIPDTEYVADELFAVHAYGVGGPVTSSPNGDWCYAAEGGAIACFPTDPGLPNAQDNYDQPDWRIEVGSRGVTPIELQLDPDMDWDSEYLNPQDPFALLYIAAGRDGLWAMDASPAGYSPLGGGTHHAYRLDDSGNDDPTSQYGRKWCNDVKLLEIGGETYLLALFARRDASWLRGYKLADVRAAIAAAKLAGDEVGHELAPELYQKLIPKPNVAPDAYAFGMAVDEDEPDAQHAKVYVAMGEQGIFRVPLRKTGAILQVDSGNPFNPMEYGPRFGEGSPYEDLGIDTVPPSTGRSLYQSVDYFDLEHQNYTTEVFTHAPFFLDVAVEDRGPNDHRLYAAVDHLGWCAFDLGPSTPWGPLIWSGPATGTGYPAMIQEGSRVQIGSPAVGDDQPKDRIRLFDDSAQDPKNRQTYARHVEFVTTKDASGVEHGALVLSASARPFIHDPLRMNEGRYLDAFLNLSPVQLENFPEGSFGFTHATVVYDVDGIGSNWTPHTQNYLDWRWSGWHLHVAQEPRQGELKVFHGGLTDVQLLNEPLTNSHTGMPVGQTKAENLLVEHYGFTTWPPVTLPQRLVRGRFHRPGRLTLSFGPSAIDPDLMVSSNNDAVTLEDGGVVADLVNGDFKAEWGTTGWIQDAHGRTSPTTESRNLVFGETMDPRGGFVGAFGGADHEYRMGFYDALVVDVPGSYRFAYRWKATKFTPSYDTVTGFLDGVTEDFRLYLTPPANKFSPGTIGTASPDNQTVWSGRPYYVCAATFPEYNEYVATTFGALPGPLEGETGYVFASVNGSPQGLWAIRMTKFQARLDVPPVGIDEVWNMDPGISNDAQGAFVTHPEYWNVDDVRMTQGNPHVHAEYFIKMKPDVKLPDVQTWYSDMFTLPVAGGGEAWILAVACGYATVSERRSEFGLGQHPGWTPDEEFWDAPPPPYTQGYHHLMVRLFDVTNPQLIKEVDPINDSQFNMDSPDVPGYTIIGPDLNTSANFAKGVRATDSQDVEHQYLLVTDIGGRVYLYDIGGLLSTPLSQHHTQHPAKLHYGGFFPDGPVATYQTHSSLSDNYSNGVYGCAIHGGPSGEDPEKIRIYLSVPRVGIEVLKLEFDSNNDPYLDYLGLIQTPGDGGFLQYVEYPTTDPPPYGGKAYLYAADYHGGLRIYRHDE